MEEWSGVGEVSSSSLAQVRMSVRVRMKEIMRGGLGEKERVREWV